MAELSDECPTAWVDCMPSLAKTRQRWEDELYIAGGGLKQWKPRSECSWQAVCHLAFGDSFPAGSLGSMVGNLDNILTAINQLQQNGLIVEGSLHAVSTDLTTLKKALCLCMLDGSELCLVK